MSNHSPSADPSPGQQHEAPARTLGNRTPRHVQWASEVDEDSAAGRIRDHDSEKDSDGAFMHELDEAGLDVRRVYPLLSDLLIFFVRSELPFEHWPRLLNIIARA